MAIQAFAVWGRHIFSADLDATDDDMPGLVRDIDSEDEETTTLPRPAASSTDGIDVSVARSDIPQPSDVPPAETRPSQDGLLSVTGIAPGTDTRGLGLETFAGRGSVRVRKGSTRPPSIPPELWQRISKKRQQIAIAEYQDELAAARLASTAAAASESDVAPRCSRLRRKMGRCRRL